MSSGTTWDANGFHTGGLEGCASTAGVLVVTTPVPWTSKQTYRAKIDNTFGNNLTSQSKAVGADWVTFVFYMRFEAQTNNASFFSAYDGTNSHLSLKRKSDNAIELYNANGTLIATSAAGLLADDTDYIFSVKFKKNNSADIQVEVGEAGSARDLIFDLTGQDLDTGGANVAARFLNGSTVAVATDFFVTTYLCRTDPGANIDTNITTEPDGLTIFGEYESINQGIFMNFGDSLSSGSLAKMFDVPVTSLLGTYTTTGVDKSGGVTMDHATLGGPNGDSRIDGTIVGSIYLWVFRTGGSTNSKFRGKHGWQSVGSEGTDNTTTTTPSIRTDNSWDTLIVLESEIDLPADPETKLLQMGFMSDQGFSNGDVDVKLMAVGLIHSEPKQAIVSSGSFNLIISRGGVTQTSGNLFIHGDTPYTGDKLYLLGWGENNLGQVDIPSPTDQFSAADGGYRFTVGLKTDRSLAAWGNDDFGQLSIPSQTWADYIEVACGTDHGLAIKANGSIIAWGRNSDGQLNIPSPNEDFIAVDGGLLHTIGLKSSGTILVWGDDGGTIPGLRLAPAPNNDFVALSAGRIHNIALTSSGTIEAWGSDTWGQGTNPSGNSDFTAISAGGFHNIGLKNDGSVFCWGSNSEGQCDVPSPNSGFIAIQAGRLFSLGLKANGTVIGWGRNDETQLDVPLPNTYFDSIAVGNSSSHSLGFASVVLHTASVNMFIGGMDENISSTPPALFINGHEPLISSLDIFIEGNELASTSGDLIILGNQEVSNATDLYINGFDTTFDSKSLFIQGKITTSDSLNLVMPTKDVIQTSVDIFTNGHQQSSKSANLFIRANDLVTNSIDTLILGKDQIQVSGDLFIMGVVDISGNIDNLINGKDTKSNTADLFLRGIDNTSLSEDLFIQGLDNTTLSTNLFIGGIDESSGVVSPSLFIDGHSNILVSADLFTQGIDQSTNTSDLFIQGFSMSNQNDTLTLFIDGLNIISDNTDLFIDGHNLSTSSSDMFVEGNEFVSISGNLIIAGIQEVSNTTDLYVDGLDTTSGSKDLFIQGITTTSGFSHLIISTKDTIQTSADLFITGATLIVSQFDLLTEGHQLFSDSCNLIIGAHEISTNSIDIFIAGQKSVQTSSDLFIKGKDTESNTADLFIQGFSQFEQNNTSTLFIAGLNLNSDTIELLILSNDSVSDTSDLFISGASPLIIVSGSNDLLIPGKDNYQFSGDLYILSSDTVFVSGNMYISGPVESSSQINLFVSASGISATTSSFGLFINGTSPKPTLVCPTLDPTASIQIKDSLITIYQSRIDALINQLGKNVQLEFTPIRVPCPNCEYDTVRKRSTGIYRPGGPRPFARGRKCPWCKGRGFEETTPTKCIKCLIKWNPKDVENFGISIVGKKGIVRFKTFLTEADDLIRAKTAVTNRDIEDQLKLRVILIKGPIPVGLRERRYCISFWELM